jgi:hypothetical protein
MDASVIPPTNPFIPFQFLIDLMMQIFFLTIIDLIDLPT